MTSLLAGRQAATKVKGDDSAEDDDDDSSTQTRTMIPY